jgi:hypothetical protein
LATNWRGNVCKRIDRRDGMWFTRGMASPDMNTRKRAAEKRGVCVQCGTSDAACTRRVLRKGKACCGTCGYTDTHPKPNKPLDAAPCSHCGGSGVEPADDDEGFYDD